MCSGGTKPLIGIIVQARLDSTRLPNKILKELVTGQTVLCYLLSRLSTCKYADKVIVATTTSSKDDTLAQWLKDNNYVYYRGSEEDCIDRFYYTCKHFNVDLIVRITSDCPFIVPEIIDDMILYYVKNRFEIDYLSNRQYTYFPEGLDVEIFSNKMLEDAVNNANQQKEREHINYFFLSREHKYKIYYYTHGLGQDYSRFKLSIDTQEDLDQARHFFTKYGLSLQFSFHELIAVLSKYEREQKDE